MGHDDAKVTIMVIKADLECDKCYKKIKRTICQFDQIQDQVYDEKNNTVTIKVVCCSPDDIMKKISRKGGASVKAIEIKKPAEKPKPPADKPKEAEKKTENKPKEAEMPTKPKEVEKPPPQVAQPKQPDPVPQPQQMISYPMMAYPIALPSYGNPPPPQYPLPYQYHGSYEVMYGRPVYDSWGGGGSRGYYDNRCDYFSEQNPSSCSIM